MAEEGSFLDLVLNEFTSRRGGGNVAIAKRFPRWVRNPQGIASNVISTAQRVRDDQWFWRSYTTHMAALTVKN
jgi:hypothetical protein